MLIPVKARRLSLSGQKSSTKSLLEGEKLKKPSRGHIGSWNRFQPNSKTSTGTIPKIAWILVNEN